MSDEPDPTGADAPDPVDEGAFGIDAFSLDDRLRLFHFAAAEKRHEYLWLLRAFDRGRANYQVLLHASDAVGLLERLAADHSAAGAVGGTAGPNGTAPTGSSSSGGRPPICRSADRRP
ncbi:DUF2397 domain-containing protein [Streptomyces sp. NBC_00390]|uniref:hypothetical protein n=1 Tax=Streptomyces sp. NBC_00390 TaxID=2975736 RepID=UPI002E1FABF1